MSLINLPSSTIVDKIVPKNNFESYANKKQRILFTNNLSKIHWANKISKETTNLAGHEINEIQVFEIQLKNKEKISEILSVIDKAIPYPILFVVSYKDEVMLSVSVKHSNSINENNAIIDWTFATEWLFAASTSFTIILKNSLDFVFEYICQLIVGEKNEIDLNTLIDKEKKIKHLKSKIDQLYSQINQCRQFNERVELNHEYQALLEELNKLQP